MAFVAAVCPQCAGALQVPDDRDTVKCMYCGVDVIVRQAIRLVSGNASHLLELALSAAVAGNHSEAYDYFNKVLEIDPRNAVAWKGKGSAAGWLSRLNEFRFAEMLVAYDNSLKYSNEGQRPALKRDLAIAMNEVASACYELARRHMLEFVTVKDTWEEYLTRCGRIIVLYESADSYDPENAVIAMNIVSLCTDNIKGVKYSDPSSGSGIWYLSDEYESRLRELLQKYAAKVRVSEPTYVAPDPKSVAKDSSWACFVVTAAVGDENHPAVLVLRGFRDNVLSTHSAGRAFTRWYFVHGPSLARPIQRSRFIRCVAYWLVVAPAALIARLVMARRK